MMENLWARPVAPLPDKHQPLIKISSWPCLAGGWMALVAWALAWPCGAAPIITNGDFSSSLDYGLYGWTLGGTMVPLTISAKSHLSSPAAQVNDLDDALLSDSLMEQSFTLPADCVTATLSAYCCFLSENTSSDIEWHYQAVAVYSGGGALPNAGARILNDTGTPIPLPPAPTPMRVNLNSDPAWYLYSYNLLPYSGQTLKVQFKVEDDAHGDAVAMWVDDVEVYCITATASPTRTHSPTSTISPTLTPSPTHTPSPTISATYTLTPVPTASWSPTPILVTIGRSLVFPNPARAAGKKLNFMYSLEEAGSVRIEVYNVLGYRVAWVEDKYKPAGWNLVTSWNFSGLAPGIYFYRLFCTTAGNRQREYKKQKFVITP